VPRAVVEFIERRTLARTRQQLVLVLDRLTQGAVASDAARPRRPRPPPPLPESSPEDRAKARHELRRLGYRVPNKGGDR
jgi:hypothetical protein